MAELRKLERVKDENWKLQIAELQKFEPDTMITVMVKDDCVYWLTPPNQSTVFILGLLEWAKQGIAAEFEAEE